MSDFTDGFISALRLIINRDPEIIEITLFSFQLSLGALFLALLFGIPLGLIIGYYDFFGKKVITVLINTFTGFPPVVMGVLLFVLLSRTGPLGALELLYTPTAMLIAQFLLAMPIIISTTSQSVSTLSKEFFETLSSLKIGGVKQSKAMIREIRSSLIIGAAIGFGRAISEVGAILILGGNIRWNTRTLTTASVLEISRGSPEIAIALGIILLSVSFFVNLFLYIFQSSIYLPGISLKVNGHKNPMHSRKNDSPIDSFQFIHLFDEISKTTIQCQSIDKNYTDLKVLENLSLDFYPGNIYVIIGPNGVGKSTFLRILSGLDKNFTGKIKYEPETQDMPYLHQTPYMFKGTVLHNLKMLNPPIADLDEFIQDFGLNELLENDACNLSGGEKRRVAIARLILTNSSFLLLDEPTADLDPGGVARIEKILQLLRDKGVLIIMTTHNLLQAKRIADKLILQMSSSKIVSGDIKEIFETDEPEIKGFIDGTLPW